MRIRRIVYWLVAGVCLGLGLDIFALGPLFLAGLILVLVGVFRVRGREAVTILLGLGLGTAAILALTTYTDFQGGPPVPLVIYGGLVISILSTVIGMVALFVVWRTPQSSAGPTASQA